MGDERDIDFWSDWWVTEEPLGLHQDIMIPEYVLCAKVGDFLLPNRSWDFNKFQILLSVSILNQIHAVPIAMDVNGRD